MPAIMYQILKPYSKLQNRQPCSFNYVSHPFRSGSLTTEVSCNQTFVNCHPPGTVWYHSTSENKHIKFSCESTMIASHFLFLRMVPCEKSPIQYWSAFASYSSVSSRIFTVSSSIGRFCREYTQIYWHTSSCVITLPMIVKGLQLGSAS